uniref:Uncharacterized protein n=1 Tax=Aegilops tauschii subsp. strangulata TaxID=200361 RepID=A0A453DQ89_AEGTS
MIIFLEIIYFESTKIPPTTLYAHNLFQLAKLGNLQHC